MAVEQVTIFELDINVDAAIKDSAALQKSVDSLKQEIKELKKAEGDNSVAIAEKTAALKAEQKQLTQNNNLTAQTIKAQKANKGSIEQLRAQLSATSIEWAKLSKEERVNSDRGKALTKQKTQLTAALKKEEAATGDSRRNVGNYNEGIQQALGGVSRFIPILGTATTAVSGLGIAVKVALGPISLLIAAIGIVVGAFKAFFNSSEEGQNTLKRLQAVWDVVVGNIVDIASNLGKALFELFENPKEALLGFIDLIKTNLINRFNGLLELIPQLGKAIGLLFKGEFSEAGKVAGDAVAKVTLGVEDFTDKAVAGFKAATEATTEFIKEQEREIEIAQRLADQQAALDKSIRNQLLSESKARLEIAKLRDEATKKEEVDAQTRLQLLDEAQRLEKQILQENVRIAEAKANIKAEQNALSNSTKEDLEEEVRLRAEVFKVQEASFKQLRRLESERQTALREIRAEEEAIEQAEIESELKAFDDAIARDIELANKRFEINEQARADEREAKLLDLENQFILEQDNIFATLELERQGLELERQQEIEFAELIGADTTAINEKYARANAEIDKASFNARLSLAAGFAGNIATIAGEGTAIGKAAAVAQTTVSTFQAAQGAYAALAPIPIVGPALGIAAALAAVESGRQNVKSILSVKSGLPGGDSVGGGGAISASTPSGSAAVRPDAVVGSINQGIVSRDSSIPTANDDIIVQPTLVTDDVTIAQTQEASNNQTATI